MPAVEALHCHLNAEAAWDVPRAVGLIGALNAVGGGIRFASLVIMSMPIGSRIVSAVRDLVEDVTGPDKPVATGKPAPLRTPDARVPKKEALPATAAAVKAPSQEKKPNFSTDPSKLTRSELLTVQRFCMARGAPIADDGKFGPKTQASILFENYRQGQRGPLSDLPPSVRSWFLARDYTKLGAREVRELQAYASSQGITCPFNGRFDAHTRAALAALQTIEKPVAALQPQIAEEPGALDSALRKARVAKLTVSIAAKLAMSDIGELQQTIDVMAAKAKRGEPLTTYECDVFVAMNQAFAIGGIAKGMPEAAALTSHYVSGGGAPLEIDADVYSRSTIVQTAQQRMMAAIRSQAESGTESGSVEGKDVLKPQRNTGAQDVEGAILEDGALLAPQANHRLKYADNRFHLQCEWRVSSREPLVIDYNWSVRSLWDFDSYAEQAAKKKDYVTEFPLPSATLRVPDGLAAFAAQSGAAKEFWYSASWQTVG